MYLWTKDLWASLETRKGHCLWTWCIAFPWFHTHPCSIHLPVQAPTCVRTFSISAFFSAVHFLSDISFCRWAASKESTWWVYTATPSLTPIESLTNQEDPPARAYVYVHQLSCYVSARVIPLTSSGQCWSTAEKLHQFAELVCHRENNRSLSGFFLILTPPNPSNSFVVPFSLFSFYTRWKLKATSDPEPARLILSKCTERHILSWYSSQTAFHLKAQHSPRDTKADSDARTSHSHLKTSHLTFQWQ